MKKILLVLGLVTLTTNVSFGAIDQNLKYGAKGQEVTELQEFLIEKGLLSGSATGNFYSLTLKAVKAYQTSAGVPSTGFVGPMTREKINAEIQAEIASSSEAEVLETGTTTLAVSTPTMTDFCPNIEGVQTVVPNGMFMDAVNGCFLPPVITNVSTPVNTGNAPSSVQAYTPIDRSSIDVKILNSPYGPNFTTNDTISFEVRAKDTLGNTLRNGNLFVKKPDGTEDRGGAGYDYFTYTYKPTKSGVQTLTFDLPVINKTKDYQLIVDEFVPIPPTATFQKGFENEFNVNTRNRIGVGYINVDQKNQRLVVKDVNYEIVSDTFKTEDIDLKIGEYWTHTGKSDYIARSISTNGGGFAIEFFPLTKPTKTGTFKVKITKLTVISNFDGSLDKNNIDMDTTGWESQEVTVTK